MEFLLLIVTAAGYRTIGMLVVSQLHVSPIDYCPAQAPHFPPRKQEKELPLRREFAREAGVGQEQPDGDSDDLSEPGKVSRRLDTPLVNLSYSRLNTSFKSRGISRV